MRPISVHRGGNGVVYVAGELDVSSREEFLAALDERTSPSEDVVLDVSDLTVVDVTGVRAIVTLAKRRWPLTVTLRNPTGLVANVFDTFQIDGRLGIRVDYDQTPSEESA